MQRLPKVAGSNGSVQESACCWSAESSLCVRLDSLVCHHLVVFVEYPRPVTVLRMLGLAEWQRAGSLLHAQAWREERSPDLWLCGKTVPQHVVNNGW